MSIPTIITDLSITFYLDGEPYSMSRESDLFPDLLRAVTQEDVDAIQDLLHLYEEEMATAAPQHRGRVTVNQRGVYLDGQLVDTSLARRILDLHSLGLPVDPLVRFMENLSQNPLPYAQAELYEWLEKSTLPITEDGHFLAYKLVKDDFRDIYSGTFDNTPGKVVTMPGGRPAVDPDRHNVCSTGLHFCSRDYLPQFGINSSGRRVVLLKINPADVVAIPTDYNHTKGRTWRYEVLREIEDAMVKEWVPLVAEDGDEEYDPWEEYYTDILPESQWDDIDPFDIDPNGNPIH